MKAIPAIRAARGGLSGRRVQAIVIGLVALVSTAASTLALGLLVASNAPFDHAFAAQHGADVTATARASAAQLAATTQAARGDRGGRAVPRDDRRPRRSRSAHSPVPAAVPAGSGRRWSGSGTAVGLRQQLIVVGRSSPGGPVDDLIAHRGSLGTGAGTDGLGGQPDRG